MIDEPIQKQCVKSSWWSTESEKDFIAGLGYWRGEYRIDRENKEVRKRRLLTSYRASISNRKDWGMIDPKEILEYVEQVLFHVERYLEKEE